MSTKWSDRVKRTGLVRAALTTSTSAQELSRASYTALRDFGGDAGFDLSAVRSAIAEFEAIVRPSAGSRRRSILEGVQGRDYTQMWRYLHFHKARHVAAGRLSRCTPLTPPW